MPFENEDLLVGHYPDLGHEADQTRQNGRGENRAGGPEKPGAVAQCQKPVRPTGIF